MNREEVYARFEDLDKRAAEGDGSDTMEKQHASGSIRVRERNAMWLAKDPMW